METADGLTLKGHNMVYMKLTASLGLESISGLI